MIRLRLESLGTVIANAVVHPELKEIAKEVPSVIARCRAENTVKKYSTYYRQWSKWCTDYGIMEMPANEKHVAIFMTSLLQNNKSSDIIESVYYAIEHFHKLNLCDSPYESSLCEMVMEASKRAPKRRKKKKEPLTAENLKDIYKSIGEKSCTLLNFRTFVMMVISYVGFLRYSEAADIRRCDIEFHDTFLKLFIEKSKTDVYRDGHWILIAKIESEICPVKLLGEYLQRTEIDVSSQECIFRGMSWLKKKEKHVLKRKDKGISYSNGKVMYVKLN